MYTNVLKLAYRLKIVERDGRKVTIRRKISTLLIVGAIILFGTLYIFTTRKLKVFSDFLIIQTNEMTNIKASELSKELGNLIDQITIVSKSPVIRTMDFEVIQDYLPVFAVKDKYRNMTISDKYGNAWSTVSGDINISDQEQMEAIFKEKKDYYISQPFYSRYVYETKKPIITIAHGIVDEKNNTIGLVNVVISNGLLENIIKEMNFSNGTKGFIINNNGVIIAHQDANMYSMKNIKDIIHNEEIVNSIINSKTGSYTYKDANNEEFIFFTRSIQKSPDWTFVVSTNKKELYKKTDDIRKAISFAIISGMIFAIVFALYYSRSLSKPILELKEVFDKAAKGNLNVIANEKIKNELGDAAKSFNIMINKIKRLTYIDSVTGFYNYNGFLLEIPYILKKHVDKEDIKAIVIISIDNFDQINSIYGLKEARELLLEFAKNLKTLLKKEEKVTRFLEKEFALFLYDNDIDVLNSRIESLLDLSNKYIEVNRNHIIVNLTIGVSYIRNEKSALEYAINKANIAKLIAKKEGNLGIRFYDYDIEERLKKEQKIENALFNSIVKDELYLLYQPIVNFKKDHIVGVESLLRWKNPLYNRQSPELLIEIAERNGFILEIGKWVLEEACKQNKAWQEKGYPSITISVNVSTVQLEQDNFVDIVKGALKKSKLEPKFLELEITESIMMNVTEALFDRINSLKEMGIRINIDDFGTGYSSLAYLTRLPIDKLKIDRYFINNMLEDRNSKMIVKNIINMARALKINTIAEGVETVNQLMYLEKIRCNLIQGYLISKPTKSESIEELFKQQLVTTKDKV